MRDNENKDLKTISLEINGMTCSGCSSHIEKDMNKTNGIVSSTVNHETGKGEFTLDTSKMDKEKLINAIEIIDDEKLILKLKAEINLWLTADTLIRSIAKSMRENISVEDCANVK